MEIPDFAACIEPMTTADLDEMVALHAVYLNYGEGVRPHFAEVLADPATVALKCAIGGRIAALCVYQRGVYLSGGHTALCEEIRGVAGDATVYTGDAMLVVKEYRHMGLDKVLLGDFARRALREKGAEYVLYEMWIHPDGYMPAKHHLEYFGAVTDLGRYEKFYYDFDRAGYYCPICEGQKCVCAAHLYLCRV